MEESKEKTDVGKKGTNRRRRPPDNEPRSGSNLKREDSCI